MAKLYMNASEKTSRILEGAMLLQAAFNLPSDKYWDSKERAEWLKWCDSQPHQICEAAANIQDRAFNLALDL